MMSFTPIRLSYSVIKANHELLALVAARVNKQCRRFGLSLAHPQLLQPCLQRRHIITVTTSAAIDMKSMFKLWRLLTLHFWL
jgi:hypothetical protein